MNPIFQITPKNILKTEIINLTLSKEMCDETAKRLGVARAENITIKADISPKDSFWVFSGYIEAQLELICSVSQTPFIELFKSDFNIMLTDTPPSDEELDFEIIENNRVDIGDLAIQYLALDVPTFPISPNENSEHTSLKSESSQQTWKAALEKLKNTPR
jgi:uncharacterized metal-binding protein YceD (DUF177 family)